MPDPVTCHFGLVYVTGIMGDGLAAGRKLELVQRQRF